MHLKSKSEIAESVREAQSVAALGDGVAGVSADDVAANVRLCCAPYAAVYSSVEAIPIQALITLALQLLPIIFGEGGFTIGKLTAILTLIQSIFTK